MEGSLVPRVMSEGAARLPSVTAALGYSSSSASTLTGPTGGKGACTEERVEEIGCDNFGTEVRRLAFFAYGT